MDKKPLYRLPVQCRSHYAAAIYIIIPCPCMPFLPLLGVDEIMRQTWMVNERIHFISQMGPEKPEYAERKVRILYARRKGRGRTEAARFVAPY